MNPRPPETVVPASASANTWRSFLWAAAILLLLDVTMFIDVLVAPAGTVLSRLGPDLADYFVPLRAFGFGQLREGNLPLWNPHLFSGTPCLAGFESSLLYPLNVLYLILPLDWAVNLGVVTHVWLAGLFMYLWASNRGLCFMACLLAAGLLMFCGPHFLHVYPGHLSNLCTMIWAPLILLAFDRLFADPSVRWALLGMAGVAMQILAGNPQYVFYTAIAVGIYGLLSLMMTRQRIRIFLLAISIYLGGAALAAIQLLAGVDAARDGVRSRGLSYTEASVFSFPPENILTFLTPTLFGDMRETGQTPYWGRCYWWEVVPFVGLSAVGLAICGAVFAERSLRRFSAAMFLILAVLSFGAHNPLFREMHAVLPGFDMFRGMCKLMYFAVLFLCMLAAIGFDHLLHAPHSAKRPAVVALALAILVCGASILIRRSATSVDPLAWWGRWVAAVHATGETRLDTDAYSHAGFIRDVGCAASTGLLISAGTLLMLAVLLFLATASKRIVPMIGLLASLEICVFARNAVTSFNLASLRQSEVDAILDSEDRHSRSLNNIKRNSAMFTGRLDIWGYDPGVSRRYAEFIAFTQRLDPNSATDDLIPRQYHRMWRILRCEYAFYPEAGQSRAAKLEAALPRLQLVTRYQILSDRDQIFDALNDPSFDFSANVVLENQPNPPPVRSPSPGTVRLVEESTDRLTIEANLVSPAILLISDAFARGWRAWPIAGSIQSRYDLIPADYVLRAIPLTAGHHNLVVEYSPIAFRVGAWLSLLSLVVYLAALIGFIGVRRRTATAAPLAPPLA